MNIHVGCTSDESFYLGFVALYFQQKQIVNLDGSLTNLLFMAAEGHKKRRFRLIQYFTLNKTVRILDAIFYNILHSRRFIIKDF